MSIDNDIITTVNYYKDLLIAQYKDKINANKVIDFFIKDFPYNVLFQLKDNNAFDLETAVGVQLDILGRIVGVDRNYQDLTLNNANAPFFGMSKSVLLDGNDMFTGFAKTLTNGKILSGSDILASRILSDDVFRIVIKYKIIQNYTNNSEKDITDSLFNFFGNDIIATSADNMEIFYFTTQINSNLIKIIFKKKILPKPIGVKIKAVIQSTFPFFAMSKSVLLDGNSMFTGFAKTLTPGKILRGSDILAQ